MQRWKVQPDLCKHVPSRGAFLLERVIRQCHAGPHDPNKPEEEKPFVSRRQTQAATKGTPCQQQSSLKEEKKPIGVVRKSTETDRPSSRAQRTHIFHLSMKVNDQGNDASRY